MRSSTVVELVGVNGERFNLTTGDRGVYLATDVKGAFFDPPVKCVYEEPGNYPGARYLNHRILRRDITFGVEILNDAEVGANSWLSRDSEWRKAWSFDKDCYLYVTTKESGTRYMKLRLLESPEVDMKYDPQMMPINRTLMVCVAGDPFWYGEDVVYTATTVTDTSFDPNALSLPWPWPHQDLPTETLTITVDPSDGKGGLNPTDQYIFPKWTVPGSTYAPAEPYIPGLPWLGAPKSRATIWTVPDYSFEDAEYATRRVRMPGLIGGLRTDEIQAFTLDGIVDYGTFKLKLGSETTGALAWDASVGTVKAALESLAAIAYNDVEVTRGECTNEVQVLQLENATGGTFTLSFAGSTTAPIPFNASDTQVKSALVALAPVALFDLSVHSKVTNEVQVINVTGEPTDGTFTLTFDGHTTDPIPWNASALAVAAKLVDLPNIALNDISVTREWWKKYSPWVVSFNGVGGGYKGVELPLITGNPDGLEGGAGMDVVVTKQTPGERPYVISFKGSRKGQNVPQLVVNTTGLTKGDVDGPTIKGEVYTQVQGSFPYIVRFRNNCSGISFPLLEVDTSTLSGYGAINWTTRRLNAYWPVSPLGVEAAAIGYRAWKVTEGYTAPAENCLIDVDPRVEQVVSESGSMLWGRMNGVRFKHPIPPYTASKTFQITVSGCVPGQMVSLRLPRPWSRPWGLE